MLKEIQWQSQQWYCYINSFYSQMARLANRNSNFSYRYNQTSLEMTTHARLFGSYDSRPSTSLPRITLKNFSYSPSDRIGKGFSAVVYKGINDTTKQTVAVKAIDMKGVKDQASRQMLNFEIEALRTVKHPNVLRCYEVIRQSSHCYIITEFCNQGDLLSVLRKKRKMPEKQVTSIMKDIVEGFVAIGENKFLHRDLKLANIFMNDGVAKIADFGFAKKSLSLYEKERYNVGSPLYMSPEALKKNIYTVKNDIWSIGIMIFELLHGDTPWECRTEHELIDKMVRIPVHFRTTVSDGTKDFIKKCLEVDESKRMGLGDLKTWSEKQERRRSSSEKKKQEAQKQPLSDATNRVSFQQRPKSISLAPQTNKENESCNKVAQTTSSKLAKDVIEQNNALLLTEINRFRLAYKIYEKIKTVAPEERELMEALGSDIEKQVGSIYEIVVNPQTPVGKMKGKALGIKEPTTYLNEKVNKGIKKYKRVMTEYRTKYASEVTHRRVGVYSTINLLKGFMSEERLKKDMNDHEHLLMHWISHSLELTPQTTKGDLDRIIEAKEKLSQTRLRRVASMRA